MALIWESDEFDAAVQFRRAKWEERGFEGPQWTFAENPIYGSVIIFSGAAFLFILLYQTAAEIWLPMATIGFLEMETTHEYMVEGLIASSRGNSIELQEFGWPIEGIRRPPEDIWNFVEVGDVLRLHDKGNRWGVFYSEIELIKQE